jgi:predicted nucleic-acid-binding protein
MIAIDTNVIIRLLTRDDAVQYETSRNIFTDEEVYIADTVILETEWVLRYAYEFEPAVICQALHKLFGLRNVHLSNAPLVAQALDWHQYGLDFADAFHLALSQHHPVLKTFDDKFIKRAKKLSQCRVERAG